MTLTRRRLIAITAGLALSSRSALASSDGARWQGTALGARADLRILGMPPRDAQRMLSLARAELTRLEALFSLYRPDSALTRLNRAGVFAHPPAELLELCTLSAAMHRVSAGLFDPSVQALWACYAEAKGRPSRQALHDARAVTGWDRLSVTGEAIVLPRGGALTFNGIAQGFIADKVVALLKMHGLETGLVSTGEIVAVGAAPSTDGWTIGLSPFEDTEADSTIELRDQAVATSNPAGTRIGQGGAGHILDPRSGLPAPAPADWQRVSMVHRSAAIADALSTAGTLMSTHRMRALAEQVAGLRIDALDRHGRRVMIPRS